MNCSNFCSRLGQWLKQAELRQVILLLFLSAVILWGQIDNEVLFSVDGIVYSLIGKELSQKPLWDWAVLTWHQHPFFEHPHLTPWILAIFMKIFGPSTLTAVFPIALLSTFTVLLAYFLGKELIDHRFGILAGTILTLTPQFIKSGRNPMLEPALMFFIMLTLYFHVRKTRTDLFRYSLFAGLGLGLAFLAKGPPAALAVAVILGFQLTGILFPESFARFKLPLWRFCIHLLTTLIVALVLVLLVDVWHFLIAGKSFFAHYFGHQLQFTVVDSRGQTANDYWFYSKRFLRYWPWMPFIVLGLLVAFWKKDRVVVPTLTLGILVFLGTFLGFTLMKHKAPWYTAIDYVGLSLLAAVPFRYGVSQNVFQRHYSTFCGVLILPVLFLSTTFPSLFSSYARPTEYFFENAGNAMKGRLQGKELADCIGLDPWKRSFFVSFYFDAKLVSCGNEKAPFEMIRIQDSPLKPGYRALFVQQPFALLEKI